MKFKLSLLLASSVLLTACGNMPVNMGNADAKTVATGSAGGASSTNANKQLEHCDRPMAPLQLKKTATLIGSPC